MRLGIERTHIHRRDADSESQDPLDHLVEIRRIAQRVSGAHQAEIRSGARQIERVLRGHAPFSRLSNREQSTASTAFAATTFDTVNRPLRQFG